MTTTTTPTAETWADVEERLNAAAAADYTAVQRELEEAEAEHRRLTEQALMGALGAVGPLDLQKVESRKQLAELRLHGLQELHRLASNEARDAWAATLRDRARSILADHTGDGDLVASATAKLVEALTELREVVEAHNADVQALLDEAPPAFTRHTRREPLVEMVPFRDDTTGTVETRPVVKRPAEVVQQRRSAWSEEFGIDVGWRGDRVTSLTVDGQTLAPLSLNRLVLEQVAEMLPAELNEPVRKILHPFRRWGRA